MPIRSIPLEQKAIGIFQKQRGKLPQSPDEWAVVHRLAYPGGLPEELAKPKESFAAATDTPVSAPPPTPSLPQDVAGSDLGTMKAGVDAAKAKVDALSQPNEATRILQEAIRTKSGTAEAPLGESAIFGKAGVGGYGALAQSLASRDKEITTNYANFQNAITTMAGTYKDMASTALANYKAAADEYAAERERLQKILDKQESHANEIELLKLKGDIDKELLALKPKASDQKIVKIGDTDYIAKTDEFGNVTYEVPKLPAQQKEATELQKNVLATANDLMDRFKRGKGTSSVGMSRLFGLQYVPGTAPKDFQLTFDSLKSMLSLDNVKLLKGQGAISESERALLANAATKLNLSQSEEDFGKTLQGVIDTFKKAGERMESGETVQEDVSDSEMSELRKAFPDMSDDEIRKAVSGKAGDGAKIVSVPIGDKPVPVSSEIADRIAKADEEMFAATGTHMAINQSFRTKEQQAELYARLKPKGARVAPPGKSFHETGKAIDVTNWKEAEPFLRKYGLKNDLDDDKGHFSLGEFA